MFYTSLIFIITVICFWVMFGFETTLVALVWTSVITTIYFWLHPDAEIMFDILVLSYLTAIILVFGKLNLDFIDATPSPECGC